MNKFDSTIQKVTPPRPDNSKKPVLISSETAAERVKSIILCK